MPIYENGPVRIHYEEAGSGFPTRRPDLKRHASMISARAAAIGRSVLCSAIRRRLVVITGKGNNRGRQN